MKHLFLGIIILIAVNFANAQSQFGLKGGLNISSIGGDAQGVNSKIGFHIGGFAFIRNWDKMAIQPEFVFSRQGVQLAENSDVKVHYDYLNVPVMFDFYASENVFFMAGPQLGILVSAKATDGNQSVSVKNQLNSMDFGFGLGLGIDSNDVVFSARYNIGVTSTSKSNEGTFPNRVFQLSVGFKFQ